jgi:hypothetical protein
VKRVSKPGNPAFVAARNLRGWYSQEAFAEAYDATARRQGLKASVSPRQVRRWESGKPPWPQPNARRVLVAMFGLSLDALGFRPPYDPDAAERTSSPGALPGSWWRSHIDDVPESVPRLIAMESEATRFQVYEPVTIPGVLQSAEYALKVIHAHDPSLPAASAYQRHQLRIERANRFARSSVPASFILGEAALRRRVGGPRVLAEQLGHLLVLASRRPDVTLQILPTESVMTVAAPFWILEGRTGERAVWLEGLTASVVVDRPDDVLTYGTAFDRLTAVALPAVESLECVDQRRRELCTAMALEEHAG